MSSQRRLKVIKKHLTASHQKYPPSSFHDQLIACVLDKQLRYTLDNSFLSQEQREFYEQNGFLLISGLIEKELIEEFKEHFIDLCEGRAEKGLMVLMKDISLAKTGAKGQFLYNKAQDILFDEIFAKYITHEKLLNYVECFTGPNIKAMHTMLINKPPDSGAKTSRHPLHQDLYYFPFRPADRVVAAWTAMEDIDLDNGCLTVIPGSHHRYPGGFLLQHNYPDWEGGINKAYHGILGCDSYETMPLIMKKGDTAFFHPLLIHGSGANFTSRFRKAISCHYAAAECDYIEVKGTLQETIAKEIEEMAEKRGLNLSFKEVWRMRSMMVRGKEGTL